MASRINTIIRREEDYIASKGRPSKKTRNLNPKYHPFQQAREYTRALNATKMDKIFAKPFLAALSGSLDSIWRLSTVPQKLSLLVSGDCNGDIRVWNTSRKKLEWSAEAHKGFVRGLSVNARTQMILTCGTDKAIRLWPLNSNSTSNQQNKIEPVSVLLAKDALMDADWQSDSNSFATAGETVSIWDSNVFKPVHSFKWGSATCGTVNFNKVEKQLLFATFSDRAVALFDVRAKSPANKLIMKMVTNSVCWNPMEPFNFILASEDSNVYSFDVRNFNKAKMVHEDHLNAVMSVDFSPTGKEFVTGSYDKTIRIFKTNTSKSREIYHTKRMQRVFATKFSLDSRFVFSGSDDTNIRVWKANASEKLGIVFNFTITLKN